MELRLRITFTALIGLIAVAVWTFPAWRGFLRERQVIEAFPGLDLDLQDDFLALPADQRQALLAMRETSPEMALGMVHVAISESDTAPEDERELGAEAARVLASGTFSTIDALHWGRGTATIYEFPDRRILRFEGFSSARGGDVRVYLSRDPQPRNALELGVDFLNLGRLKGNIGNQNYILPENHDLSIYRSAVVYCKQFEVVITSARLR
ncbi:MAG: DM13 domain-containing protein [Chloroflexi bacterium]|nr:DM13 domain-containing protein [Chloroflexota bacterium]